MALEKSGTPDGTKVEENNKVYRNITLLPEEIIVETHFLNNNWACKEDHGMIVALNTEVTPELEKEGLSRDFVRNIQNIRKELDLYITDHIAVLWHTDSVLLSEAIIEYERYICSETLCDRLSNICYYDGCRHIIISGHDISVLVKKSV